MVFRQRHQSVALVDDEPIRKQVIKLKKRLAKVLSLLKFLVCFKILCNC